MSSAAAVIESVESRILLSDGGLDKSFGVGGVASFSLHYSPVGSVTKPLSNGKILVLAGATGSHPLVAVRFNADGSIDNTFHRDGVQVIPNTNGNLESTKFSVNPKTGEFIACTLLNNGKNIYAFNADGTLNKNFSDDGVYFVDGFKDAAIDYNDRIYYIQSGGTGQKDTLVALTPRGQIDTGFAGDGQLTLKHSGTLQILTTNNVLIQPNDRDGYVVTPSGKSQPIGPQIHFSSDNDYQGDVFDTIRPSTTGGIVSGAKYENFLIDKLINYVVYNDYASGAPPTKITIDPAAFAPPTNNSGLIDVVIDPSARPIILNNNFVTNLVRRFTPDGKIDTSFGNNGIVKLSGNIRSIHSVPGGLIVSGTSSFPGTEIRVIRLKETDTADRPSAKIDTSGRLNIIGSPIGDQIALSRKSDGTLAIDMSGERFLFNPTKFSSIRVFGQNGNDTITIGAGVGAVYVEGGHGDDSIQGGDGNDTIFGNAGLDTVLGGGGNDQLYSGQKTGTAQNNSFFAETINGQDGNDLLVGSSDNVNYFGEKGNDTLQGGAGKYDDGTGSDRIIINAAAGTTATLNYGDRHSPMLIRLDDRYYGSAGEKKLLKFSGGVAISVVGGSGNDTIVGSAGKDDIDGGAGDDSILGGDGNDLIDGLEGNDSLFGGNGNDVLQGGDGADSIRADAGNDSVFGDGGNDTIFGGPGADDLNGDAGNDSLTSNDGTQDDLHGGAGTDTAVADAKDLLFEIEVH